MKRTREKTASALFAAILAAFAVSAWMVMGATATEQIRQPKSEGGGAATITSTTSGDHVALDVNVATGTISLGDVEVTIESIDTSVAPMSTKIQATPVTLGASATGTISCGGSYNGIILAHTATDSVYYSYTTNGSTGARMILFAREKFVFEGQKYTFNSINIYNPTGASCTFYLECWR